MYSPPVLKIKFRGDAFAIPSGHKERANDMHNH
jgi:hypothetical protein